MSLRLLPASVDHFTELFVSPGLPTAPLAFLRLRQPCTFLLPEERGKAVATSRLLLAYNFDAVTEPKVRKKRREETKKITFFK